MVCFPIFAQLHIMDEEKNVLHNILLKKKFVSTSHVKKLFDLFLIVIQLKVCDDLPPPLLCKWFAPKQPLWT